MRIRILLILQHQTLIKRVLSEIIETKACPFLSALYNPFDNNLPVTVVTNPPYGERMGNFNELIALYGRSGAKT